MKVVGLRFGFRVVISGHPSRQRISGIHQDATDPNIRTPTATRVCCGSLDIGLDGCPKVPKCTDIGRDTADERFTGTTSDMLWRLTSCGRFFDDPRNDRWRSDGSRCASP